MIHKLLLRSRPELRVALARARPGFRAWRGARPFWAGLFTLAAGVPIIYFPYVGLSPGGLPLALSTTGGAGSLIIGILLVVLGITLWLQQHVRVFAGIAAMLLALASFPMVNFGGMLLGLLCGLVGGSLACAWVPPDTAESLSAADHASAAVPVSESQGER
ncbi:DUF6114 domain-containing protein [Streptomyces sp. NPDC002889]|uniref:DUF6114 domain-containing protein n=1 Tax=Streptomyces sp. NPDC002889 TaxID=3364669 RepID=UPI0036CBC696